MNSHATTRDGLTVAYCRISLDAAGEGLGVERQEKEVRALADRNGWVINEVIIDNDLSATTGVRRPGFERLLSLPLERVLVWHTDRLVRKTGDLERVIDLGVPVFAVTASHLDLSTPSGRAVARTVTAWAQYEGEQKSLRQKAAHRQRAEQGRPFWSHRRPFGFNPDGTHHESEAAALKECYRMYQENGATFEEAAKWLSAQGFTTSQGARWSGSRLARLMRDPRNAGLITYHEEIVGRGNWEPIIPQEQFNAVVARSRVLPKQVQPQGEKIKSLLGGIGHCQHCGDPFRQTWSRYMRQGEKVATRIYQPACHDASINADYLDRQVEIALFVTASSPSWNLLRGEHPVESEAMAAANEAKKARDKADELMQMFVDGELSRDEYNRASARNKEQLAKVEKLATSYYGLAPLEQTFGSAGETMEAWRSGLLTLQHKREAVQRMFADITLRKRYRRNEPVSRDMFTLIERNPVDGSAGHVFTQWPAEGERPSFNGISTK